MKSETKNWPHEIIDFLYKKYSETTTELNRFLYDNLKLSPDNTTHKDKIKEILNSLKDKGYLKWKVINVDDKGEWIKDHYEDEFQTIPNLTLKNNRVEAQLTINGLDYAIELEREKQKHNIYKWATPLGTGFAFLAFFVSLLTYLRGCGKTNDQAPKVEVLMSPQQQTQKSSVDKPHVDFPKVQHSSETNLSKHDTATATPNIKNRQ